MILINQLSQALKSLARLNEPNGYYDPHLDWKNQQINSERWKYSIQYTTVIDLARKLFFNENKIVYSAIDIFCQQTGNSLQILREKDKTKIIIKTNSVIIRFSHAYNYEP